MCQLLCLPLLPQGSRGVMVTQITHGYQHNITRHVNTTISTSLLILMMRLLHGYHVDDVVTKVGLINQQ